MSDLIKIKKLLKQKADPKRAIALKRYFKCGVGEYGEGDKFIGITLPDIREVVREYKNLSLKEIAGLIKSKIHEERTMALAILVEQFKKAGEKQRTAIFKLYLKNTSHINNWDLVDISAPKITGPYLEDKPKDILYQLAKSQSLWERRIAIMSTAHFIRQKKYADTLKIAELLLKDKHDLIHKAVGWMLREVGKQDRGVEEQFLKKHCQQMPRTMLRYAIEKFPEPLRKKYLIGQI